MKKSQSRKLIIATIAVIVFVCIAALGLYIRNMVKYSNCFYPGTTINGMDVSGMTVAEVEEQLQASVDQYRLNVIFQEETISIYASQIDLVYNDMTDIQSLKDAQNAIGYSKTTEEDLQLTLADIYSYDKDKVKSLIGQVDAFDTDNMTAPENAELVYSVRENAYHWENGRRGNTIRISSVVEAVDQAINSQQASLDLWEADVYDKPDLEDGNALSDAILKEANDYLDTELVYVFNAEDGKPTETIDYKEISRWLYLNADYEICFDTDAIQELVQSYAEDHVSEEVKADFVTASGVTINIDVPVDGASIDTNDFYNDILTALDEHYSGERDVPYAESYTDVANNFGGNYVEVDITNQKLYLFKHGKIVLVSNVVTGSVAAGHNTPTGVYTLQGMQRNTVLVGADYESPVSYWMPFNGGVGFHDATWRSVFGGSIYQYDGSHGCVNMPLTNAGILYANISIGYYVIVYDDVPYGEVYDPSAASAGKEGVTSPSLGTPVAEEVIEQEEETEELLETDENGEIIEAANPVRDDKADADSEHYGMVRTHSGEVDEDDIRSEITFGSEDDEDTEDETSDTEDEAASEDEEDEDAEDEGGIPEDLKDVQARPDGSIPIYTGGVGSRLSGSDSSSDEETEKALSQAADDDEDEDEADDEDETEAGDETETGTQTDYKSVDSSRGSVRVHTNAKAADFFRDDED